MKEKVGKEDRQMGPLFLMNVLVEEIGELAKAVRNKNRKEIAEEISDTLFCSICLANAFDLEIEEAIIDKYVKHSLEEISKKWTDVTWK